MKLIHMENLHRSIFFLTFDSDNAISWEVTMNETDVLQPSAVVGNWLIHGCQILICKNFCILHKIVFAVIYTVNFFIVTENFLAVFQFTKHTIVFWNLSLSYLPNLWQATVSWLSTNTSISAKTDITDSFQDIFRNRFWNST